MAGNWEDKLKEVTVASFTLKVFISSEFQDTTYSRLFFSLTVYIVSIFPNQHTG